jgi:hypothetical protein
VAVTEPSAPTSPPSAAAWAATSTTACRKRSQIGAAGASVVWMVCSRERSSVSRCTVRPAAGHRGGRGAALPAGGQLGQGALLVGDRRVESAESCPAGRWRRWTGGGVLAATSGIVMVTVCPPGPEKPCC